MLLQLLHKNVRHLSFDASFINPTIGFFLYQDFVVFMFRSTPCPNVKHGDEWGEPGNCESGDACPYCHTRTEQQFHPEIYKSTKCNDVQTAGYCPRGVFCAFAHVERKSLRMHNV